ncbi:MAG: mannose-1-phosphate guanylyltransferase [Candidatus Omnitrophica bacterium]|nr:mannose-1-phosphate guanylyltransferase [Candidatus Omnitrophota bacterium]
MVYKIVMAGGKGERLWPLSRRKRPKQMLSIFSKQPMIKETYNRVEAIFQHGPVWVITGKEHLTQIKKSLPKAKNLRVIAEPVGRNTAACIGLAAILIEYDDPNGIMVALPSDHYIEDGPKFKNALIEAVAQADHFNSIVTIGIWPTYPSTGYGYLELGSRVGYGHVERSCRVYAIEKFIEKPTYEAAQGFLKSGKFLWNSGIFVWRVSRILDEIKQHIPALYAGLQKIKKHIGTSTFSNTLEKAYKTLPNISIDYGVMERCRESFTVIGNFRWSDVGAWASLEDIFSIDREGNVVVGPAILSKTRNSIIFSDSKKGVIGIHGLDNVVVVKSGEEVLVCRKDKSQEVKELIAKLSRDKKFSHLT